MKTYPVNVVGESFQNDDGSDRQKIIRRCRVGMPISLQPEPDNPYDSHAIAVVSEHGQIGYLARGSWVAEALDEGKTVNATIKGIEKSGPLFKRMYGVVLEVLVE